MLAKYLGEGTSRKEAEEKSSAFFVAADSSGISPRQDDDARNAGPSVPKMGIAASGRRFEGWTERRGNCQNMSVGIAKSVILKGKTVREGGVILPIALKTLSLLQKDICLPSLGTLALGVR